MRSINILDINANDGWQVASNKINENFRNVYRAITGNSSTTLVASEAQTDQKLADTEARISKTIKDAEERINKTIEDAEKRIDDNMKKLEDLEKDIEDNIGKLAPAVGMWIYYDSDPSTLYPGTTWVRGNAVTDIPPLWHRTK